jgi:small subunit ribosomal protein S7
MQVIPRLRSANTRIFGALLGQAPARPFILDRSKVCLHTNASPGSLTQAPPSALSTSNSMSPIFVPPPQDPLLFMLTSELMEDGKRVRSARTVAEMLEYLHSVTQVPPLPLVREAIASAAPCVKVITYRKPSKNVQVPFPLGEKQRTKLAVKWIIKASEARPHRSLHQRLAHEILAILKGGENSVLKKKEAMHQLAVVNR